MVLQRKSQQISWLWALACPGRPGKKTRCNLTITEIRILREKKKTSLQGIMLSHRKKFGSYPWERTLSHHLWNFKIQCLQANQISSLLPWTKLAVYLSVSLRKHEPSEVQMDGFCKYNWKHTSPYVRKASTCSDHSYNVSILGPRAWGHQITEADLWKNKWHTHTHTIDIITELLGIVKKYTTGPKWNNLC